MRSAFIFSLPVVACLVQDALFDVLIVSGDAMAAVLASRRSAPSGTDE